MITSNGYQFFLLGVKIPLSVSRDFNDICQKSSFLKSQSFGRQEKKLMVNKSVS